MMTLTYNKLKLSNGLTVLHYNNKNTPFVNVGLLYKVGSKVEKLNYTGLAHLFEHLMFSGSKKVKNYDQLITKAYGESNAYTNNDFTYYYTKILKENLELVFFIENDRMNNLLLNDKKINIQKKVVIEEFKEYYINKPYGDLEHIVLDIMYKNHPYQWPTIGHKLEDIQNITKEIILEFYNKWYDVQNCIFSIAGNVELFEVEHLIDKYFNKINKKNQEPIEIQINNNLKLNENIEIVLYKKVPLPLIFIGFYTVDRLHKDFYPLQFLSYILGDEESSILYNELVVKKGFFSSITCTQTEYKELNLLTIKGKYKPNFNYREIKNILFETFNKIYEITDFDVEKLKNLNILSKIQNNTNPELIAENLAYYEYLSDADLINKEFDIIKKITVEQIINVFEKYVLNNKCFILHYLPKP